MTLSYSDIDSHVLAPTDQQQLTAILDKLPATQREALSSSLPRTCVLLPPAVRAPFLRCVQAVAAFDPRPLPTVVPLIGPPLRSLSPEGCAALLERVLHLAHAFPAGVVPLFRSLGRVCDEAEEQRVLDWIAAGEAIGRRKPESGAAFFALTSRTSLLTLHGASPGVRLSDIQGVLLKYLHMLSGAVVSLTETETVSFPPPLGERAEEVVVPLPSCIELFSTYEENFRLYRVLVAHQVGRLEFGTYECSPAHLWPSLPPFVHALIKTGSTPPDDLPAYFLLFPRPDLIEALFVCVEGKRIAARLTHAYQGLQADLTWAESLTPLVLPMASALLSRLPDGVWSDLGRTGTASDSLQLATQLYADFLQAEPSLTADSPSASQVEACGDVAGESMAFLTGVDLGGRRGGGTLAAETPATHQRQRQTPRGLHYVYDEWDYEIEDYRPHWCQLREVPLLGDEGVFFARTLATYAHLIPDIKQEFQRLRPRMYRQVKGLEDGEEIDLNALVAARVDRATGVSPSTKLYAARQLVERDVAVLFLLDLSASTAAKLPLDAPDAFGATIKGQREIRLIDVLKEALVLLSDALEEIGDAYAVYGFSSNGRYDVAAYPVKLFTESLSADVKGRIGALAPQGSTRMGTAVRHATRQLKNVTSRAKLLVLLSDGYPEDTGYGKPVVPPMYGLRDTMMAFREAERSGIVSFCLSVDQAGHDYLREMCPPSRYLVIEDIVSLPTELPKIYQRYLWSQWL